MSQCNVGQWSASPAVCEPTCQTLTMPTNANSCQKTLITESFTTASASLARWQVSPAVPAAVSQNYWALVNGKLRANFLLPFMDTLLTAAMYSKQTAAVFCMLQLIEIVYVVVIAWCRCCFSLSLHFHASSRRLLVTCNWRMVRNVPAFMRNISSCVCF